MNPPLAFLLTFRTYGTWLHGDPRGSVDDEHNIYGTPRLAADEKRLGGERLRMRDQPMVFDDAMRRVVEAAIRDAFKYRNWDLVELAVRSNHVHLVVAFAHVMPEDIVRRLKSRATKALRDQRLIDADRRVWADGVGSRKYLWTERDVADAALYVREYQEEGRE